MDTAQLAVEMFEEFVAHETFERCSDRPSDASGLPLLRVIERFVLDEGVAILNESHMAYLQLVCLVMAKLAGKPTAFAIRYKGEPKTVKMKVDPMVDVEYRLSADYFADLVYRYRRRKHEELISRLVNKALTTKS